jgi:ABC-type lipoprotein release transport system permease subunit
VVTLVLAETLVLCAAGALCGGLLAVVCGQGVAHWLASLLPLASNETGLRLSAVATAGCGSVLLGLLAGAYPGWRAGRIPPALAMQE